MKSFPTSTEKVTDYSGYERDIWPKRTDQAHRDYANQEFAAKTKADKKQIEKMYGARYSILYALPYFNCVRFVVVDIMHNLFLRPGSVQYYIQHNVMLEQKFNGEKVNRTMHLAYVNWYKKHPEKTHFRSPVTVWYPDHVPLSQASFMPISRIACRCMQSEFELSLSDKPHHNGKVVVINPISCANSIF